MKKNKDTNLYTLHDLTATEVRSLGYQRWMRRKKIVRNMFILLAWMVAWFIPATISDIDWMLWVGIVPLTLFFVIFMFKEPKAEKRFYEKIKEEHNVQ